LLVQSVDERDVGILQPVSTTVGSQSPQRNGPAENSS